jgi:hypothetical protein
LTGQYGNGVFELRGCDAEIGGLRFSCFQLRFSLGHVFMLIDEKTDEAYDLKGRLA